MLVNCVNRKSAALRPTDHCFFKTQSRQGLSIIWHLFTPRWLNPFSVRLPLRSSQAGLNVDPSPCRFRYLCVKEPKAKQETLVKYFDQMADALKDGLPNEKNGSNKFIIAQTKTVIALQSLDRKRQHLIVQFLLSSGLSKVSAQPLYEKYGKDGKYGNPQLRVGDFVLLYKAQMSKANLVNSDWSGLVLVGANLKGADLGCLPQSKGPSQCSDLSESIFSGADLSGADLRMSNLSHADLRNTNLSGANLSGADLSGADLRNTNLSSTNLSHADFSSADLRNTNLSSTNLSHADFSSADLRSTSLHGDLSQVSFFDADLRNTNLSSANLSHADFRRADLSLANLSKANLSEANFTVYFHTPDIKYRQFLRGAKLSGADLSGANLHNADLTGAKLSGADLSGVNLSDAILWGGDFKRANLKNTNLSSTNLSKADFSGTDLSGVNLSDAILFGTDLRQAKSLTRQQLVAGESPPLLCNVALPKEVKINTDRDCDRLAQTFSKRYLEDFPSLEDAKQFVDDWRKNTWK